MTVEYFQAHMSTLEGYFGTIIGLASVIGQLFCGCVSGYRLFAGGRDFDHDTLMDEYRIISEIVRYCKCTENGAAIQP